MIRNKLIAAFLAIPFVLVGCGGGSDGDGGGTSSVFANRFVLSGNSDGTMSIFRGNSVTGYATAMSYFDAGDGFSIQDMIYDQANSRVVLITSEQIIVLGFDVATGVAVRTDARSTSGNSSHLTINSAGTAAYVASGTSSNQTIDYFEISGNGTLSAPVTTSLNVDPDYIKISPTGTHLYLLSRSDDQIQIFDINADSSLAATAQTVNTGQNPTSIEFNFDGTTAYVTRQDNNEKLVVYEVAQNGNLTQSSTLNNGNSPVDMVLSVDGLHLYVVDSGNNSVHHYSVDVMSGTPTFVSSTNVSFTPTDIAISGTGSKLFVGHSESNLVSSITIDSGSGALSVVNWVRAFDGVQSVAAVDGPAALTPRATFLMAPDATGLRRFTVGAGGMLSLSMTENNVGALIDGEVEVNYPQNLLFGAGEAVSPANTDFVTSYTFNPVSGTTSPVSELDVTVDDDSSFQRIELGRSGRFMYALDVDIFSSSTVPAPTGTLNTYSFTNNGTINSTRVDFDSVGEGPENLSMHPAGRYIYSIDSFGDRISIFEVNESTGELSSRGTFAPGSVGSGVGRPVDMRFHPNGRFAYVVLQDDSEVVRFPIESNGQFGNNPGRLNMPPTNGLNAEPRAIAVHPNGRYVYVGEGGAGSTGLSQLTVNQTDYSLSISARTTLTGNPSWISIDPMGEFLYVRYSGGTGIQVFTIDAATGALTDSGQTIAAGSDGGFLPTMTLVAPLQ